MSAVKDYVRDYFLRTQDFMHTYMEQLQGQCYTCPFGPSLTSTRVKPTPVLFCSLSISLLDACKYLLYGKCYLIQGFFCPRTDRIRLSKKAGELSKAVVLLLPNRKPQLLGFLCVCVCVCVCEREREREKRECTHQCNYVRMQTRMHERLHESQ